MGSWDWAFALGGCLLAAGGLLIALVALFRDRARGRRRCPRCWYDLSGVPGLTCPECGRAARSERGVQRTRRRWGRSVAGGLVMLIGWGFAATPRVARTGAAGIVPTPVLAAVSLVYDTHDNRLFGELVCRIGENQNRPQGVTRWLVTHRVQKAFGDPDAGVTVPARATRTQWIIQPPTTGATTGPPAPAVTVTPGTFVFNPTTVVQAKHAVNLARQLALLDADTAGAAAGAVRASRVADLKTDLTYFVAECEDGLARARLLASILSSDPVSRVRTVAAEGLGRPGTDADVATSALTEALKFKSSWTRRASAVSLGRLGTPAAAATPALAEAARKDRDFTVMIEACRALRLIGTAEAGDALCELTLVESALAQTRLTAAHELGQSDRLACRCAERLCGPAADGADSSRQARALAAMSALVRVGCEHEAILVDALANGITWQARADALAGLVASQPRGAELAEYAMRAMGDPSPRVRRAAVKVLCTLGDEVSSVRAAIVRASDDEDDHVRFAAEEWIRRRASSP